MQLPSVTQIPNILNDAHNLESQMPIFQRIDSLTSMYSAAVLE